MRNLRAAAAVKQHRDLTEISACYAPQVRHTACQAGCNLSSLQQEGTAAEPMSGRAARETGKAVDVSRSPHKLRTEEVLVRRPAFSSLSEYSSNKAVPPGTCPQTLAKLIALIVHRNL